MFSRDTWVSAVGRVQGDAQFLLHSKQSDKLSCRQIPHAGRGGRRSGRACTPRAYAGAPVGLQALCRPRNVHVNGVGPLPSVGPLHPAWLTCEARGVIPRGVGGCGGEGWRVCQGGERLRRQAESVVELVISSVKFCAEVKEHHDGDVPLCLAASVLLETLAGPASGKCRG